MITMAFEVLLMVCVVTMTAAVMYLLYRVAILTTQVGMLQDWSGEVSYELLAQEQAREVALMRDRMQDIERELTELRDWSDSSAVEVS
ncbi:hypothetical protein [Nocardia sp. CNY236]|uniref:hypothetical protein n=1 Tax=Nocardia sp. CNY236 TaxID=1169152 RepID=UPI00040EC15B|nr:hypothetical protein [Nocardia sp. CNY236]